MFENNIMSKENLNSLLKNTRELLKEINSPKKEYNLIQEKIDFLNKTLNNLIVYLHYQEENNATTLLINLGGIKAILEKIGNHIKPIEVKTDKYNFKLLPGFFNRSSTISKSTQQYADYLTEALTASSNLLEDWLKDQGWLKNNSEDHNKQLKS